MIKEMKNSRKIVYNISTVLIVFLINIVINFGLSSYIVEKIGQEAYGFISLANTFINYAAIISVALNSMGARFIAVELNKKNLISANEYFSSIFYGNIILTLILTIPSIIMILYLDNIINIPIELVFDVKILFALLFLNFFISLFNGLYSISTYCTNNIYLTSIKNMQSSIIKLGIIVLLFLFFKSAVSYIAIATLIASIFMLLYHINIMKKLLPNITVRLKHFNKNKLKKILSSGIWNSVTNLGNALMDGIDLLISNIYLSPTSMGSIALSKTISIVFNNIIAAISNTFQPSLIESYVNNNHEEIKNKITGAMKISGIFGNIPFAFICVFGCHFLKIWVPNVEIETLYILSLISFFNVLSAGITTPLYNVYTVTNDVKKNAMLRLIFGVLNIIIVIILINITIIDIYVIVGTSAVIGFVVNLIIVPPQVSKILNLKSHFLYEVIFKYYLTTFFVIIIFYIIKDIIIINNLLDLILLIAITGFIGLAINLIFFIGIKDVKEIFLKKIKKGKSKNE